MSDTKICSTCGLEKNKERDFSVNRANPDGRDYFCKVCKSNLGKTRRRRRRIYFNPTFEFCATDNYVVRNCEVCNAAFYPIRPSHKRCETCSYLVRDTQSHLSANRNGKYLIKCSVFQAVEIVKLLITSDKCCYCGRVYTDDNTKSIDHIVPIVRGGDHKIDNINISCLQCNLAKRDLILDEWIDLCERVACNRKS